MALLRPQQINPRLVEIGRIFKGSPKQEREKDGRTYQIQGTDLDYFRFEPNERLKGLQSPSHEGTLYEYLNEKYAELGDAPRTLKIRFLGSTVSEVFKTNNEVWAAVNGKSRCVRRCDGETQLLHLTADKKLSKEPLPCAAAEGANECPNKCKPTGMLFFMLPDLQYPGQIVLTTHSINDILEIQSNLALYEQWDLSNIPFRLCRTKRTITRNDNGELKSVDKWLCHIEIDPSFGNALLGAKPKQFLAKIENLLDAEVLDIDAEPLVLPPQYLSESDLAILGNAAKEAGLSKQRWIKFLSDISPNAKEIPYSALRDVHSFIANWQASEISVLN